MCLVGHTPLRLCVMWGGGLGARPTDAERAQIAELLDAAYSARGASACPLRSSTRTRRAGRSRHASPTIASCALFDLLSDHGAFVEFIPNLYSPSAKDEIEHIAEAHRVARRDLYLERRDLRRPATHRGMRILDRAGELQAAGVSIHPQVSPRSLDAQVNWESSMAFMPLATSWHRFVHSDTPAKRAMLEDPEWRAAARAEWDATQGSIFPVHRPEKVRFVSVTHPEHQQWVGRTLADLAADRRRTQGEQHLVRRVRRLDAGQRLRRRGACVVIGNDDPDGVAAHLTHPAALLGASDAGAHLQMFCASGDSTLLLTRHVRDRGDMTLEHAVHQLTGRQAELFGFRGRGTIAPGQVADLTVFALEELEWLPEVFVDDLPAGAVASAGLPAATATRSPRVSSRSRAASSPVPTGSVLTWRRNPDHDPDRRADRCVRIVRLLESGHVEYPGGSTPGGLRVLFGAPDVR